MTQITDPYSVDYKKGATSPENDIPLWLRPVTDWWNQTVGSITLPQNTGVNPYSGQMQPTPTPTPQPTAMISPETDWMAQQYVRQNPDSPLSQAYWKSVENLPTQQGTLNEAVSGVSPEQYFQMSAPENTGMRALELVGMGGMGGASVGAVPAEVSAFAGQSRAAATVANLAGSEGAQGIVAPDYFGMVGGYIKQAGNKIFGGVNTEINNILKYIQGSNLPADETIANVYKTFKPETVDKALLHAGIPEDIVNSAKSKVSNAESFAGNIRLEKYSEETRPIIQEWVNANPDKMQAARRGIIPDDQVAAEGKRLAEEVGSGFATKQKNWKAGQAWNAEEITALRGSLQSKTSEIAEIQKLIQGGDDSTKNLLRLELALKEQAAIQETVHGVTAEAGRALRAFRQEAFDSITANDTQKMEKILSILGGKAKTKGIADMLGKLDLNDPYAVNAFIRALSKPKWSDYLLEIFYNSILSNPKTHIVNLASNTLNSVLSPIERTFVAGIEAPLAAAQGRPRQRFFGEAAQDVFGLVRGIQEGVRAAWHTIKNGAPFESIAKYDMKQPAFTGKAGAFINMPSRFLEAADQFGKAINKAATLRAEAYRIAKTEGLKGQAFIDRLEFLFANPTEELLKSVNKNAEYRLFRQNPDKWMAAIMRFRDLETPSVKVGKKTISGFQPLRYVIPFLRTPANLVKYGLERSPLGILDYRLVNKLASNDPAAADQLGRWIMGSTTAAAIALYVADDKITGAAPTTIGDKDLFYRQGKQPYSIKIGDQWVSYQRLEPFNQVFSQIAAVVQAINDKKSNKDITQIAGQTIATMAQNFASQTYMSGIAEALASIEDPIGAGGRFLQQTATGFVPYSGLLRGIAQATDNTIRQPKGLGQTVAAGLPGLSATVPPKINVFGEPSKRESPAISPINVTQEKDDRLTRLMAENDITPGFVGSSITGRKLTEQETKDYQIVAGQVLKRELQKAIDSPEFNKLTDPAEKKDYLDSVVSRARTLARTEYLKVSGKETSQERVKREAKELLSRSYDTIEDRVWQSVEQQYPGLRAVAAHWAKLESSGTDAEKAQAKLWFKQYPAALNARRNIANAKINMRKEYPEVDSAYKLIYGR